MRRNGHDFFYSTEKKVKCGTRKCNAAGPQKLMINFFWPKETIFDGPVIRGECSSPYPCDQAFSCPSNDLSFSAMKYTRYYDINKLIH